MLPLYCRRGVVSLDRAGAIALIVGASAYIALMVVHPSHTGAPVLGHLSLSALVHGTALFVGPLLGFGYAALAARLGLTRPLPAMGLVFCSVGVVFGMLAGTMSGLVIPEIMQAAHIPAGHPHSADPATLQRTLQAAANYTVWLNRSFAQVHYAMFSIAMIFWCIAWTQSGVTGWVARGFGLVVAIGLLGWQISGTSNLEARHGALVVTLGQMLWTLMAAAWLFAPRKD
jgi:hypothetical protein